MGEEDGRVDAFLDQGEVKVLTRSDPRGEGNATITVTPFERVDGLQVQVTGRPETTTLSDRQERALWVEASENEILAFEAVGRFVEDMRLWRDGSWLVDASPTCRTIDPVDGQPMRRCQLVAKVSEGQYQMSVYGGPGQPWAVPGDDTALHLVRGVPVEGGMGRKRFRISGTGTDRLWVPKTVGYAHIALDDNADVTLRGGPYSPASPFEWTGTSATIEDASRLPTAAVRFNAGNDGAVLTVEGPPGTDYVLTWFSPMSARAQVHGDGQTFIGTLQAADPADVADPTGLLYRDVTDGPDILARSMGLQIDSKRAYQKELGVGSGLDFLLDVQSEGRYIIESELAMTARVEPLLTTPPEGYQRPPMVRLPWDDTLAVGHYRVTLRADAPGITTLTIRPNGWSDWVKAKTGFGPDLDRSTPGLMTVVDIDRGWPLTMISAGSSGVESGLVVRDLPLTDLTDPIPLSMMPGQELTLPIQPDVDGILEALTVQGTPLSIAVDGGSGSDAPHILLENHTLTIRNDGDAPVRAMLGYRPDELGPALTRAAGVALPDFDELGYGSPAFIDLDADSQHTFLVRVAEPGLYRVASTGLLATSGTLRGRVRLSLGSGDQNGIGRNFNVARYLRTADYQLSVRTRGKSAGHLGVTLVPANLVDGGDLLDGIPARVTLPAGEAVRYTFTVEEAGTYRVQSRSQSGTYRCRIEDQDGWPRTAPSVDCDLSKELQPGTYGVLVLPEQVETRRITTLSRVRSEALREGHGPHRLALGEPARHVWVEAAEGEERLPDLWRFVLPARARVSISAGDEMAGTLLQGDETVGRMVPGRTWSETLDPGAYRVALRAARKGTGIPYRISVHTDELVVGVSRRISVPDTVMVAVGEPGMITLASRGGVDVRARLSDAGRVVASNDDRPDDWNFRISTWLDAGRYALHLESVSGAGSTTVEMKAPEEHVVDPAKAGQTRELKLGTRSVVVPLRLPSKGDLIQVRAQATETVGIAIEVVQDDGTWRSLAKAAGRSPRVAARRRADADTRLRVWSLDERGGSVALTAYDARPRNVGEAALTNGTTINASTPWPAVKIGGRTGLFALEGARSDVWICPRIGQGCVPAPPVAPVTADGLVLLGRTLWGHRLPLSDEAVIALDDLPVSVDVPDADVAVLIARTSTGQPGAQFEGGASALGERAVMAIDLGNAGRARVWRGSDQASPVQTRLRAHPLRATSGSLESAGQSTLTIPAEGAVKIDLGKEPVALRLGLERGSAVAVSGQVIWADERAATTELIGRGEMWLLNPTDAARMVTVQSQKTDAGSTPLVHAHSWERVLPAAGLQTLAVAPDDGGRLRVRGASLRYLRADGRVEVGDDLEVGPGGTAWLSHGPGTVLAWVDHFDGPGPWREVSGASHDLPAGSELPLRGHAVTLNVNIGAPGVAHVRVTSPFVAWVGRDGVAQVVHVDETGGMLDLWLPDGTARLILRGVADGALTGTVSLTASNASEIAEGLGPEVLLLPGSSRWFRFSVTEKSLIGVGVAAEADRVLATVYATDGTEVASGLIRRVRLEAGTWLLALSQAADGAPIRARPAVAGLDRPDTGPPDKIIREYLVLAGLNPQGGE